jgi:hypothetical protein
LGIPDEDNEWQFDKVALLSLLFFIDEQTMKYGFITMIH